MTLFNGLGHAALRDLALGLEYWTGSDSIDTVETHYRPDDDEHRPFRCPFPRCNFRRNDPVRMWRHIHFGKHGLSFGIAADDPECVPHLVAIINHCEATRAAAHRAGGEPVRCPTDRCPLYADHPMECI